MFTCPMMGDRESLKVFEQRMSGSELHLREEESVNSVKNGLDQEMTGMWEGRSVNRQATQAV